MATINASRSRNQSFSYIDLGMPDSFIMSPNVLPLPVPILRTGSFGVSLRSHHVTEI
jgi:hypothetical protein